MPRNPRTFTVADPATFDGNPYEVADRALAQALAVADVLTETIDTALPMLRSADYERQIALTGECSDEAFENAAWVKRLGVASDEVLKVKAILKVVRRAATFDPKHPPKE